MQNFLIFNQDELTGQLASVRPDQRMVFALSCTGRLLHSYNLCASRAGTGDRETYNAILARLWSDLDGLEISDSEMAGLVEASERLLPRAEAEDDEDEAEAEEEDQPSSWLMEEPLAEDATLALYYAVQCRASRSAFQAALTASQTYDALDGYVTEVAGYVLLDASLRAIVRQHPLIQAEFRRQARDIDELLSGEVDLKVIRERVERESQEFIPW